MSDELRFIHGNTIYSIVEDENQDSDEYPDMVIDDFVVAMPDLSEEGVSLHLESFLPSLASTADKGIFGQLIVANILEYATGCPVVPQDYHHTFDLKLSTPNSDTKIDVKLSSLHKHGKSYRWQFTLSEYLRSGTMPSKGSVQTAPRKQRKDYTKSCDWIVCVGMKHNGTFELFIIPSTAEEATKYKNHIPIPEQWQTTPFVKWWIDTSGCQTTGFAQP